MEDHPTTEDFRSLLQQSSRPISAERNALAVRHLLGGCEACRATVRSLRGVQSLFARLFEYLPPISDSEKPADRYDYDWAFAKAGRSLAQHLTQGLPSKSLPERLAELDLLPDREQIHRVSTGARFSEPELIECLIDRSHAARYDSPRKTLHLALLARLASEQCTPERIGGEDRLSDLQAQAWGAFANAQRICGRLIEAADAFEIAFRKCETGSKDPGVRRSLLVGLSSLRIHQRRFDQALQHINEAEQLSQVIGDLHRQKILLVQRANILLVSGEPEAALPLLQEALSSIDRTVDPDLVLVTRHNLFFCYAELNRPDEALAVHVESREIYQDHNDLLVLLRATWQEGKLLREIGHLHNAEAALIRARQGFIEQDLAYEAAMVSLDLAEVYRKLGRFDDLRKTLAEALPIFRSLRASREVLASLLRLQQAAEEEDSGG